jgi:hypothetical protein
MKDNKLIAEFMGMQETNLGWVDGRRHILNDDSMSPLLFHTSWDWLMPCLQKILDLTFSDDEKETSDSEYFYLIRDCVPDINHTYKAVVEFIKWYNQNKEDE